MHVEIGKQEGRVDSLLAIRGKEIKRANLQMVGNKSCLEGEREGEGEGEGRVGEKIQFNNEREKDVAEEEGKESHSMSYCAAFSEDLKRCTCSVRRDSIRILPPTLNSSVRTKIQKITVADQGNVITTNRICPLTSSVTLVTVTSRDDFYAGSVDRLLKNWCGPKVRDFCIYDASVTPFILSDDDNHHWRVTTLIYLTSFTFLDNLLTFCVILFSLFLFFF